MDRPVWTGLVMSVRHDDASARHSRRRRLERIHIAEIPMWAAPNLEIAVFKTDALRAIHAQNMQPIQPGQSRMAKRAGLHGRIMISRQRDHVARQSRQHGGGALQRARRKTIMIERVSHKQEKVSAQSRGRGHDPLQKVNVSLVLFHVAHVRDVEVRGVNDAQCVGASHAHS